MYYIAWVLEGEIACEIRAKQELACERFHSCKALRSPPHVTIVPPFYHPPDREEELSDVIMRWSIKVPGFDWELSDYSHFDKRVIYARIKGPEWLSEYRKKLFEELNILLPKRAFRPHVTVAFRDLKREQFTPAWRYFSSQKLRAVLRQNKVSLLRHTGSKWEIIRTQALKGEEISC